MDNLLAYDLEHILNHTRELWEELRGQRIFVTGGTGFFGCWLLESFAWANDRLRLNATAAVLTRDPQAFGRKAPHLAGHPSIRLHVGDVRTFQYPEGAFSHIIHAAAEPNASLNQENAQLTLDTIVEGTRRTLEFAVHCRAGKLLLTSSGAVYGRQPPHMTHIPEDYTGAPDPMDSSSAYGQGKRLAEHLCALYSGQFGIETKVARGFAFAGPYLPLDRHFAIGNFIADGLRGGPLLVKGDGTPCRSYLYAADLAIWLWTILVRGKSCRPYNVGSDEDLSIAEVARWVAEEFGGLPVQVAAHPTVNMEADRYVPNLVRAQQELGLRRCFSLAEALRMTVAYYRGKPGSVD